MTTIATLYRKFDICHSNIKSLGDPRVAEWFLVKSPVPVVCIFLAYVLLVLVGPKLMRDRKPFNLKPILFVYNAFQIALSAYMFYEFLLSSYLAGYDLRCQTVDYSDNPLALRMADVCWWFFFSKVIDLLDTVFFILRKKNSQVSFLHVYHHATMIFNWWAGVKFAPGGQSFFCALLNSFVHVIMYTYYFLSAFGPSIQPYLWWKKYLTQLQLVQFVLIITHVSVGIYNGCDFPNFLTYSVVIYCLTLIALFANFYVQAYIKRSKRHEAFRIGTKKQQ